MNSHPWELIAEVYENLHEAIAKSRRAESGLRWEDGEESRAILVATRHVRSQLEPLVEYLGWKLDE